MADKKPDDVAVVLGPDGSGDGMRVLRVKGDPAHPDFIASGIVRPLVPGQAVTGDLVSLSRRGASPLYDIETVAPSPLKAEPVTTGHAGPARVSSEAYREGWDRIFKKAKPDESAN